MLFGFIVSYKDVIKGFDLFLIDGSSIQQKPSQKLQWFPLKYHYKPLAFSSKTITKFLFVVCFGHFSNMI